MAPPRKALIAVPAFHRSSKSIAPETTQSLTVDDTLTALAGLFVSEALHPFNVFRKSGFEVDFASETGTYKPDWLSLREDYFQGDDAKTWEDRSNEFRSKLDDLHKPGDVKAEQYGLSLPQGLQGIAAKIYSAGGIVSAVCHGPAILPGITDAKTGKLIVAGTKVTGFATKDKEELGALKTIKEKWNALTIEEPTTEAGAFMRDISPPAPLEAFAVADGLLVAGANPASANAAAEGCLIAFEKLDKLENLK